VTYTFGRLVQLDPM